MNNRIVKLPFILTVVLLFLFSMNCVFADESPNLSFKLVHQINIDSVYQFIFKNSSNDALTSVVLEEGQVHQNFASLYLQHASNLIIKGLTVVASDLKTEDESAVYPYTMSVTDKNGNAIEWVTYPEGSGSGYAHLVDKTTVFRYKDTGGLIKFADFSIDLSTQEEIQSGTYSGTMVLRYVVI